MATKTDATQHVFSLALRCRALSNAVITECIDLDVSGRPRGDVIKEFRLLCRDAKMVMNAAITTLHLTCTSAETDMGLMRCVGVMAGQTMLKRLHIHIEQVVQKGESCRSTLSRKISDVMTIFGSIPDRNIYDVQGILSHIII